MRSASRIILIFLFIIVFGGIFLLTKTPSYSDEEYEKLKAPIIQEAIAKKDFHICERLPEEIEFRSCPAVSYCMPLEKRQPVQDCLFVYTLTYHDVDVCAFMNEPNCFSDIALAKKDPEICTMIDSTHSAHWRFERNRCIANIASLLFPGENSRTWKICDLMVEDEGNGTFLKDCKSRINANDSGEPF